MKIDLHIHTSEISVYCGKLSKEEIVDLYIAAGYDAIVLTNHYSPNVRDAMRERYGVTDFTAAYFDVIRQAAEIGRKKGLLVLPGCELRFACDANDYLVFGMTEELFGDGEEILNMTPRSFSQFAGEHGVLFYQAHPFRNGCTVVDPQYLFGVEVQNTHPRHDSRNDIALAWAEKFGLRKICGSDCHQSVDVGTSALITDYPVKDINDLIHVLKNDLYTMN